MFLSTTLLQILLLDSWAMIERDCQLGFRFFSSLKCYLLVSMFLIIKLMIQKLRATCIKENNKKLGAKIHVWKWIPLFILVHERNFGRTFGLTFFASIPSKHLPIESPQWNTRKGCEICSQLTIVRNRHHNDANSG